MSSATNQWRRCVPETNGMESLKTWIGGTVVPRSQEEEEERNAKTNVLRLH